MCKSLLFSFVIWMVAGVTVAADSSSDRSNGFPNEYGWNWLGEVREVNPASLASGNAMSDATVAIHLREGKDGALFGAVARKTGTEHRRQRSELRLVAFDSSRQRYVLAGTMTSGNRDVLLQAFASDATDWPASRTAYIGLEELTEEGRHQIANLALDQARESGLELLPLPQLDKPYEFSLTTIDGKKVTEKDYTGKVLLIDGWATWCTPCMVKMPELKATYDKWHKDGFEILGINLDFEKSDAKRAIARLKLSWPQVYVPDDDEVRDHWAKVGFKMLPRLLLIDRKGVLRGDLAPHELQNRIETLLAMPANATRP